MEENTFLPLFMDKVFIDIFGNIDNIKFSEYLLECLLGLRKGYLKNKLKVRFETTLERQHQDKTSRCDLIYTFDDILVNLECYSTFDYSSFEKSCKYFSKLSNQVLVKNNSKYKKLIQINLIKHLNMQLAKQLIDEQTNKPLQNRLQMVHLRLDYLNDLEYNLSNKRSEDLLLFLKFISAESYEERKNIAKERKILMELDNVIEDYFDDGLKREDFDFEKNNAEASYRVGFDEGKINGKKQGLLETAKNLLAYGMPIEDISKNTSLSLKEIKNISFN